MNQEPPESDTPSTGLDHAPADRLAELIDVGVETIDDDAPLVAASRPTRHLSPARLVFAAIVIGLVAAVGWWSWRMVDMGATDLPRSGLNNTPATVTNPKPTPSPWVDASLVSLPGQDSTIALEATFDAAGRTMLVAFSDGSTRVYPIVSEGLGNPQVLNDAARYPLAVRFGSKGFPEIIVQSGAFRHQFGTDGLVQQPLQPHAAEVYHWDAHLLVTAPLPFDGSVIIQRDAVQTRHPWLRFIGIDPASGTTLLVDREDLTRIGILTPDRKMPRFVTAPGQVHHATVNEDTSQLTAALTNGTIVCLNAETGKERWRRDPVPGIMRPLVRYTPTGELLVAEHRLLLIDPSNGQIIADLTPAGDTPLAAFDLIFSSNGQHLCVLGNVLHLFTSQ